MAYNLDIPMLLCALDFLFVFVGYRLPPCPKKLLYSKEQCSETTGKCLHQLHLRKMIQLILGVSCALTRLQTIRRKTIAFYRNFICVLCANPFPFCFMANLGLQKSWEDRPCGPCSQRFAGAWQLRRHREIPRCVLPRKISTGLPLTSSCYSTASPPT